MKIKVSVIVPVYNCKMLLERAIESVVSQKDFFENELILIDDGSTDGSSQICDKYNNLYDNIKVIHQQNSGVSSARNNGIKAAEGEWIFFLDSDDYLIEDAFEKMFFQGDADLICARNDSNVPRQSDFLGSFESGLYESYDIKDELINFLSSSNQFFFTCWAKLFKRSLIVENSILFPDGQAYAEDMVFVYTYLRYCKSVSFVKDQVYYYFVNENNATSVVPKSFEVESFIFNWQSDYFKNFDCDYTKIYDRLVSVFLYRTFLSIKTAAIYMNFWESVKYLDRILNDEQFHYFYTNSDEYYKFNVKSDELLDRYIRKKKPIMIYILYKLLDIKSKFYKIQRGVK